jgi:hypothetical protein
VQNPEINSNKKTEDDERAAAATRALMPESPKISQDTRCKADGFCTGNGQTALSDQQQH